MSSREHDYFPLLGIILFERNVTLISSTTKTTTHWSQDAWQSGQSGCHRWDGFVAIAMAGAAIFLKECALLRTVANVIWKMFCMCLWSWSITTVESRAPCFGAWPCAAKQHETVPAAETITKPSVAINVHIAE